MAVDPDPAPLGVVESRDELGECRLPGSGSANERNRLPGRNLQAHIAKRPLRLIVDRQLAGILAPAELTRRVTHRFRG